MKHDINFVFLVLIAVLLMSMVGMAIYYGSTYQELNSHYHAALRDMNNKSQELNNTIDILNAKNEELDKKKAVLGDIIERLNLSKERDFQWENIYLDTMQKKDQLEEERKALKENLAETENEKKVAVSNLTQCRIDYQSEENKLKIAENNLNIATSQVSELAKKNTLITQDIDSADGKIEDISGGIDNIDSKIDTIYREAKALDVTENETAEKNDLENDIERVSSSVNDLKNRIEELQTLISRIKKNI